MRTKIAVLTLAAAALALEGAAATDRIEARHTFKARAGQTVVVDASFHDVEIHARPGDTVEVEVEIEASGSSSRVRDALEALTPRFDAQGSRLVIRSVQNQHGFSFGWSSLRTDGSIVIAMPPDLDVEVDLGSGTVRITGDLGDSRIVADTGSGSVVIQGAARIVEADTGSGAVEVEVTRPLERFAADTGSGSVRLVGGAAEAEADTGSGSVRLEDLTGDALADTGSGGIHASWASIPPRARVRMDSGSGSVELTLPAGTVLDGEIDTGSGRIRSDFRGRQPGRSDLYFDGGAGAVDIQVDTGSGSVTVRER